MYELKTKLNDGNVLEFLNKVDNKRRREDSLKLLDLMQNITKDFPKMWGDSIIGFGEYAYTNKSGFKGEWMKIGFSPRKQSLTLYIMNGYDHYDDLLSKLGKHRIGKSCLYINKLADIDIDILSQLIEHSYNYVTNNF